MDQQRNLAQRQNNVQPLRQTLSQDTFLMNPIKDLMNAVLKRYGKKGLEFLNIYNADFLFKNKLKVADCYFGNYPTLAELNTTFDNRFSSAWLMAQLYDLSEYCGCKEKLSGVPLRQCANIIASDFYYMKVTELMLFFRRFKSGSFDKFYGVIDPLIISVSLRSFVKDRAIAYRKREQEKEAEERKEWVKNAVTWEEYCTKYKPKHIQLSAQPKKKQQVNHDAIKATAQMIVESKMVNADTLKFYTDTFVQKYGCTPHEYLKKEQE